MQNKFDKGLKVVFLEGVDGAGKTTCASRLLSTDLPIKYFRSSFQSKSTFANEPVNLEESIKHDWRILYDFILQTQTGIILVDRGFMSSYVYSKVVRHIDLEKWFKEYVSLFSDFSEYWIFLIDDNRLSGEEQKINICYESTAKTFLTNSEVVFFKNFKPWPEDTFIYVDKEIEKGRFDSEYYSDKIWRISKLSKYKTVLLVDIDGTITEQSNVVRELAKNKRVVVVTGRIQLSDDVIYLLHKEFREIKFDVIYNNRNLGLSSRALKEFCIRQFLKYFDSVELIDDREDLVTFVSARLNGEVKKLDNLYHVKFSR